MSRFASMKLSLKIVLSLLFAGFLSVALVGGITYFVGLNNNKVAYDLEARASIESRSALMSAGQGDIIGDLEFLTKMRDTAPMFKVLSKAIDDGTEESSKDAIKNAYVDGSPHPVGEREFLDAADDGTKYSAMHKRIHPTFREYLYSRGYYDIFLINLEGDIIYSVFKESDFLTNLVDGEFANSGLGEAFRAAVENDAGQYAFSDFGPYEPSNFDYAGFAAMPVYASPGFGLPAEIVGVVAVQLKSDQIQQFIRAEGADSTKQTYVVRQDGTVITDLPRTEQNEIGLKKDASAFEKAKNSMVEGIGMLGGVSVLEAKSVSFLGANWYIVQEEAVVDAHRADFQMRNNLLMTTVPVLIVIGLIASFIGVRLAKPVVQISDAMVEMKNGNLDVTIPWTGRGDEIGTMASNTDAFREKLAMAEEANRKQAELEENAKAARAKMLNDLEVGVGSVVTAVSSGKFTERVDANFEDEAFRNLGDGVNRICDVVQSFMDEVEAAIGKLAEGDLTARVTGEYEGRYREVGDSLNETSERLGQLVAGIKTTGHKMNDSIRQVAEGSTDLARRAESQAASLEETAATMDKMTETIDLNAKSAQKAENLASDTRDQAVRGRGVVEDAVNAMGEIEASSRKITDIISVIDSIAFQTNLLALNAAVEAARAGDAGKGFAVVASEVRTLAQRSSEAAKDITDLITVSSEKVSDGVDLVNATGVALNDITSAVSAFSETISSIAKASQEQSLGVSEISGSISHMDEMTQHNATLADSSASAARSLTSHADQMSEMIAVFKTGDPEDQRDADTKPSGDLASPENSGRTESVAEAQADIEWEEVAAQSAPKKAPELRKMDHAVGEDWSDF